MTVDNEEQVDQVDQDDNNDEVLDVIEQTLNDMHDGDSYDDTDEDFDEPEEETQAEEGKEDRADGVPAGTGKEEADQGEAGDEGSAEVSEADDDKLRESMNEKTASRFDHFRNTNKELNAKFEEVNQTYTELKRSTDVMNKYINDSQISPEQLSTALTMAKAMNSGDFETARAAFPRMKQWMNAVAVGLGDNSARVQLPDDLKTAVDNLDITPELAQQQALIRTQQMQSQQMRMRQQQMQQQSQQQMQAQQQNEQQQYQNAQTAAQQIDVWERETASRDPDFNVKREQMLKRSEAIMQNNPPQAWPQLLKEQYELISDVMTSGAEQQRRNSARNQGIRPGAGGGSSLGGLEPEPKSFEDTFNATLRGIRG